MQPAKKTPEITPQVVADHNLTPDEYARIIRILFLVDLLARRCVKSWGIN